MTFANIKTRGRIMKTLDWFECRIWGLGLLAFGLLLAPLCFAQQTWDYTGAVMVGTSSGLYIGDAPTSIAGDVVLAQALNPNQANQIVTPVSYAFIGLPMLSSTMFQSGLLPTPVFEFSTKNGAITSWDVALYGSGGAYADVLSVTTKGDSFQSSEYDGPCGAEHNCGIYTVSNSVAGAWADPPGKSVAQAPELSTNVAALTLLICGVAVLKGRRNNG